MKATHRIKNGRLDGTLKIGDRVAISGHAEVSEATITGFDGEDFDYVDEDGDLCFCPVADIYRIITWAK